MKQYLASLNALLAMIATSFSFACHGASASFAGVPTAVQNTSHSPCDRDVTNNDGKQRHHCRIIVRVVPLYDVLPGKPNCDVYTDYQTEVPFNKSERVRWVLKPVVLGDTNEYFFAGADAIKPVPVTGSNADNLSDGKTEADDDGLDNHAFSMALKKTVSDATRTVQYAINVRSRDRAGVLGDCIPRDPIIVNQD